MAYRFKRAFSLLEVLIAMVVFTVIVLGALSFLGWTLQRTQEADRRLSSSLAVEDILSMHSGLLVEYPALLREVVKSGGILDFDTIDPIPLAPGLYFPLADYFPHYTNGNSMETHFVLSTYPLDVAPEEASLFLLQITVDVQGEQAQATRGSILVGAQE